MSQLRTVLLIVLFVYAGSSKLSDIREFSRQLTNQPLPESWVPVLVYGLPILELAIALSLVFAKLKSLGLLLYAMLMAVFTGYIALILLNVFERVPCSCGGVLSSLSWGSHLIFNLCFLFLSLYEWRLHNRTSH